MTPSEIQAYAKISSEIGTELLLLKQNLPEHSVGRKDLERIAQIKHLAALLYLTERLPHGKPKGEVTSAYSSVFLNDIEWEVGNLGPWRPTAQEDSLKTRKGRESGRQGGEDPSTARRLTEYEPYLIDQEHFSVYVRHKNRLVTSIIELISTLPDMATLLWPFFVLGNSGLVNEEQRRFVLDRLVNIQTRQNLGSVRRTIDAVKHAFTTHGLLSSGEKAWGHETYRYISLA